MLQEPGEQDVMKSRLTAESVKKALSDQDFLMHCHTMTFVSLLLELFGHVIVTLNSLQAAWMYLLEPRMLTAMVHISQLSDVGGLLGGKFFGKTPFCQILSPKKTVEGFVGCILFAFLTAVGMQLVAAGWE